MWDFVKHLVWGKSSLMMQTAAAKMDESVSKYSWPLEYGTPPFQQTGCRVNMLSVGFSSKRIHTVQWILKHPSSANSLQCLAYNCVYMNSSEGWLFYRLSFSSFGSFLNGNAHLLWSILFHSINAEHENINSVSLQKSRWRADMISETRWQSLNHHRKRTT